MGERSDELRVLDSAGGLVVRGGDDAALSLSLDDGLGGGDDGPEGGEGSGGPVDLLAVAAALWRTGRTDPLPVSGGDHDEGVCLGELRCDDVEFLVDGERVDPPVALAEIADGIRRVLLDAAHAALDSADGGDDPATR